MLGFSGDHKGSDAALRRAIEADSRYTPALGNLAAGRFRSADLAGAERLIRRASELEPDDPHYHGWMGILEMYTLRLEEADVITSYSIHYTKLYDSPWLPMVVLSARPAPSSSGIV